MISEVQEGRITDYLVSQNLSLDILIEIRDHMIQQIIDVQIELNLNFEEAFTRVKESWSGEFKMVSYQLFFPMKIPLLARRIIKEKYNTFLKKSLMIALLSFGVNLMLISMAKSEYEYTIFFRLLNGAFLLAAGSAWILNFKIWKYMRADFKYKGKCFYTMYQQNISLMVICSLSMMQVEMKNGNYVYQFFKEHNHSEILPVLLTLLIPFILQAGVVFTLFNFSEHKKNLVKMQNFLTSSAQ
ncbi:hypothetical protein LF887_21575 [Chryseobacterium sp. MEBOG06]|uniref:hypothetical protein n=1 Tax=unclassified Chryseobacterium TaxID=2593645 RepID=UPI001F307E39|nr:MULTISPECIES: hypothetical protein [unclassified Chryseobacterium]UKB83567.1 hypothetical protein LF887_21575 [Chryseobacterium sp. MEBOG06]